MVGGAAGLTVNASSLGALSLPQVVQTNPHFSNPNSSVHQWLAWTPIRGSTTTAAVSERVEE
jgi:hypothetical protein